MAEGTPVTISGDAASSFREYYNIDSAAQAAEALGNADALFNAGGHPWAGDARHAPDREMFDWAAGETKRRYDTGRYQDGELAARRKREKEEKAKEDEALHGHARHVAHEAGWKAVCTAPDLCHVGDKIVPFDSYAIIDNKKLASPDVKAQGTPVYRVGDLHQGVLGDAGSHVEAGTSLGGGHVKILTGQNNVKVNQRIVARQDSACKVNCNGAGAGGAMGRIVTEAKSVSSGTEPPPEDTPNDDLQKLIDADQDQRSLWQKAKDAAGGLADGAQRLGGAAVAAPGQAGIGVLKGIGNLPTDLWNLGVFVGKHSGLFGLPTAVQADLMDQGALAAYQAGDLAKANALAAQAQGMRTSWYADDLFTLHGDAQQAGAIASAVVPVGAIAKLPATVGKAGRVGQALDKAADAADAGRVADAGGDAMDAQKIAEAGRAGDGAGGADGVHVKPKPKPPKRRRKPREPRDYEKKVQNADGSTTYTKRTADGELVEVTYRDGYPEFDPYEYQGDLGKSKVDIEMTGDNNIDFKRANEAAGFGSGAYSHPEGYIWHHNQNMKTMQLVRADVHEIFPHTGGASGARAARAAAGN